MLKTSGDILYFILTTNPMKRPEPATLCPHSTVGLSLKPINFYRRHIFKKRSQIYSVVSCLKRLNNFLKQLITVAFSKYYLNTSNKCIFKDYFYWQINMWCVILNSNSSRMTFVIELNN